MSNTALKETNDMLAEINGRQRQAIGDLHSALTGMCDAYVALLLMKAEDPSRFQEPGSPYGKAKALLSRFSEDSQQPKE